MRGPRRICSIDLWTGFNGRAAEGSFAWDDGAPVSYTHWNPGEPSDSPPGEDCGELYTAPADFAGFWNDGNCTFALPFVCEAD